MWRAFSLLVGILLACGLYAIVTGGVAAHSAPAAGPSSSTSSSFGFALAAGAVALAATVLLSRPRLRYRR